MQTDARETLEVRIQLILEICDVLYDIFVRPFTRREVLGKGKELGDKHGGEVGSGGFGDEVTECGDNDANDFLFDGGLGDVGEEGNDVESSASQVKEGFARDGGETYLLICSATSSSKVRSQKQKATW